MKQTWLWGVAPADDFTASVAIDNVNQYDTDLDWKHLLYVASSFEKALELLTYTGKHVIFRFCILDSQTMVNIINKLLHGTNEPILISVRISHYVAHNNN
jgi:hypothetical protein